MILVEGRGIYLCTPSTGSRTVADVLTKQCGGRWLNVHGTHHAEIQHMHHLEDRSEPVITTIREPYDYVLTRYWYKHKTPDQKAQNTVEEYIVKFARENREGMYGRMFGSHMCLYRDYVDRFFLFEEGQRPIFEFLGFPDVEIPNIGKPSALQNLQWGPRLTVNDISEEAKRLIEHHFAMELELYRKVATQKVAA